MESLKVRSGAGGWALASPNDRCPDRKGTSGETQICPQTMDTELGEWPGEMHQHDLQREHGPEETFIWDCSLQNCQTIHFLCFGPQIMVLLMATPAN